MNFSLYPYNMYILCAAAAALLICLILTGKSALGVLKELKTLPLSDLSAKAEVVKTKSAESKKILKSAGNSLKTVALAFIVLKMLDKYSDKEESNAVKRVGKAATSLVKDTRDNMKFLSAIRKSI